jgi:hypothetical protein
MNLKARAAHVALFFSLILCCSSRLCGQEFRATLAGQVTDTAGAAVTGAKITVRNIDTGETSFSVSGDGGDYQVGFLVPGNYSVSVEKPSFKTSIREGVRLEISQYATVDFQLAAGSVDQSVVVTGQAAQLETESADRGLTIGQDRVLNMPTQGHNPIAAAWSAPGVVLTASAQRLRAFDISGSSNMAINGSTPYRNEVLVDGVTTLSEAATVAYVPTADATSEFRVQTTNFDAQYGWTLGGVINMTTKNGTNNFHGAAWEYFQNTVLDANTFNSNLTGTPRTSSHVNTFGFDVGGPIIKNKLFFSYTYEDLRQVIPDPFIVSVPTAAQKSGDFSQTHYAAGQLQAIYDPLSTVTGPGGTLVRTQFPGNVIPQSRLNPVAVKVLSYVPNGNVAGNSVTGLNNLTNNSSTRKFTDYFPENTARVDYDFNSSTRLFVRYSRNALQEERSFRYSTVSTINPADTGQNNPFTRENHNATIQLTKTLNPTTVLDVRIGFERFKSESGAQQGAGVGPGPLGFSSEFAGEAANWFPAFIWANYNGAGAEPTYTSPIAQTNVVQASMSKVLGKYDFKFGVDLRLLRGNSKSAGYNAGYFSFDQEFTGANPLQIQPSSGNAIASFLLGTPATGYIQQNSEPARQEKMISFYVQNGIRLSDKLKLDLGLRWDYMGPLTDRFNGLARGFASTTPNPLQVPGETVYGGLLFAGVGGNPRGIYNRSWGDFGPRAGVSYQWDSNTVFRGGYGLVYGQTWNDPGEAPGFSQQTNMVSSVQAGIPYNTLSNPFPTGILHPQGASLGLETALGQSLSFADPDGKAPYVQQFTVEIQRQLPWDFLLSASYIGARFSRLPVSQQINAIPVSAVGLGATALTQSVANPFAGLVPGTALNAATVQRQQLLAPYPEFLVGAITGGSGITEEFEPIGTSSYNAGQFLISKRLSHGLDFSVAYTISKQLDQIIYANAQDTHLEKVIASWDIPQNLQINFLWQLPFGSGRAYGANLVKPVRWAISGWDASSLTRLQAGMPLDLTNSPNSQPIANPALSHPSYAQWFNSCTQLANGTTEDCRGSEQPAWTVRPAYTFQTWKTRLSSVRLPGVHNSDISIMKNNQLTEKVALIFRTDFINAFNSPQFFSGPISDVNNADFGEIAGAMDQSNLPRFIQFSLKVRF